MNAWPEAVWIVRKMKKFFNLDARVTTCTEDINILKTNITSAVELVNQFQEELEGLEDLINLETTLNDINERIETNSNQLLEIGNMINNLSQTPAIFDTDINDDDIPDEKPDGYTTNSVWFVES